MLSFSRCTFPEAVHRQKFPLFRFLCFFKNYYFYSSSFTMSAFTATIAKKKVTTLPTTLDDASISDFVLERVFDKVSRKPIRVDGKLVRTAKSILGIDFDTPKVDQIRKLCSM
jgi:hypothetical protein